MNSALDLEKKMNKQRPGILGKEVGPRFPLILKTGFAMSHRKFGRKTGPRKALLRNLVTSFFIAERIETTEARAKEINRLAERMITLAKRGDLHARRQALAYMLNEDAVTKLFEKIGPRYEGRTGGYTRIIKKGYRRGDAAPVVVLELVGK